jgi:hypothetical protein
MSNKDEQLKGLLDKFKAFLKGEKAEVKMKLEFSLADGTAAVAMAEDKEIDALEAGAIVNVVTDQGEKPIADGDHVADNGTTFQTEGGKVTSVLTEEEAKAAAEEVETGKVATLEAELAEMKKKLEEKEKVETEMTAVKADKEKVEVELKAVKEEVETGRELIKLAKELIEQVNKTPAAEPPKPSKSFEEMSPREKAIAMGTQLNKLAKQN